MRCCLILVFTHGFTFCIFTGKNQNEFLCVYMFKNAAICFVLFLPDLPPTEKNNSDHTIRLQQETRAAIYLFGSKKYI